MNELKGIVIKSLVADTTKILSDLITQEIKTLMEDEDDIFVTDVELMIPVDPGAGYGGVFKFVVTEYYG